MLVSELISHLSELPPELEVYTAGDDEGNSYRKLYFTPGVHYIKTDGWEVHTYAEEDITDDPEDEDIYWDKTFRGDLEAVVIVG